MWMNGYVLFSIQTERLFADPEEQTVGEETEKSETL